MSLPTPEEIVREWQNRGYASELADAILADRRRVVEACAAVAESFHGADKWYGDVRDIADEIRALDIGEPAKEKAR